MNKQKRLELFKEIDIYPVTSEQLSEGRNNFQVLADLLAGGVKLVQLREKELSKSKLYEMAREFRAETHKQGALLIINDHVDIALAVGADGVHLGQTDLPLQAVQEIAPALILGASSHSLEQALEAQKAGADYVNIGPIFPTQTKENPNCLGVEAIKQISPQLDIPFTVMGGITLANIQEVLKAGASRIAMISGITRAPNIENRVRELRELILRYK